MSRVGSPGRDAQHVGRIGIDPAILNSSLPVDVPVDVSVDHSLAVDPREPVA